MIRYDLTFPDDPHWIALWKEIKRTEQKILFPYDIDSFLKDYNAKTYLDNGYVMLRCIKGIEFDTEEDLVFFKLKFN